MEQVESGILGGKKLSWLATHSLEKLQVKEQVGDAIWSKDH